MTDYRATAQMLRASSTAHRAIAADVQLILPAVEGWLSAESEDKTSIASTIFDATKMPTVGMPVIAAKEKLRGRGIFARPRNRAGVAR